MVSRQDVDELKNLGKTAYLLARSDLQKFWNTLPFDRPADCRDLLVEFVPALVNKYGKAGAVAALDWYEKVRAETPGLPVFTPVVPTESAFMNVEGIVRAEVGLLWEENAAKKAFARKRVFEALDRVVDRSVRGQVRATITHNARRDPAKPRYARVPAGAKTCAFCTILASRGFVYKSAETAGMTTQFHSECDCQIVPEFKKGTARIKGYDPDALYEKFQAARSQAYKEREQAGKARTVDNSEIAQQMRIMFPGSLSDGEGVKRSAYKPKKKREA